MTATFSNLLFFLPYKLFSQVKIIVISPIRMETFNVLQKLGQGTFGIVYLCERKHNKQKIVVKEIFIDSNNDQLQSARNEVTVLKALQHPNIIQHYDSFGKHGSFYIVMEYARGGTLHEHIKNNQPNYFESDVSSKIR